MISAVAFVPQAPALVPTIGRGLDAELGGLRSACRTAVGRLVRDGARLEVLGAGAAREVADWLVEDVGPATDATDTADTTDTADPTDPADPAVPTRTALLVLGDGSARRSEKAPGHLDARAAAFDAGVAAALRSGDPGRLAGLDGVLGAELLAAGVPAWHEASARLAGLSFTAELSYDDAPFGVGYFVASWVRA